MILFSVNANQIRGLWTRFTSLDKDQKGHLSKDDFRKIPELQNNPLGERIVQAFFKDGVERRLVNLRSSSFQLCQVSAEPNIGCQANFL